MTPLISAILANLAISTVLIALILAMRHTRAFFTRHLTKFTAITVGVILALVFFDFIPQVSEQINNFGAWILAGILIFYFLELILHWHHCRDSAHGGCHTDGNLLFFGTFLHNFFHGIVIFSSFTVSPTFGLTLSAAILLHALPQNIANFLTNHKNEKGVIIATLGGVFGAILSWPLATFLTTNRFFILALIAGGLLYIALSDILPSVEKGKWQYLFWILVGILAIFTFHTFT